MDYKVLVHAEEFHNYDIEERGCRKELEQNYGGVFLEEEVCIFDIL